MTSISPLDDDFFPFNFPQRCPGLCRLGIGADHLPLRALSLAAMIRGKAAQTTVRLCFRNTRPWPLSVRFRLAMPADGRVMQAWASVNDAPPVAGACTTVEDASRALARRRGTRSDKTIVTVVRTHPDFAEIHIEALSSAGRSGTNGRSVVVTLQIDHPLHRSGASGWRYSFPTGISDAARMAVTVTFGQTSYLEWPLLRAPRLTVPFEVALHPANAAGIVAKGAPSEALTRGLEGRVEDDREQSCPRPRVVGGAFPVMRGTVPDGGTVEVQVEETIPVPSGDPAMAAIVANGAARSPATAAVAGTAGTAATAVATAKAGNQSAALAPVGSEAFRIELPNGSPSPSGRKPMEFAHPARAASEVERGARSLGRTTSGRTHSNNSEELRRGRPSVHEVASAPGRQEVLGRRTGIGGESAAARTGPPIPSSQHSVPDVLDTRSAALRLREWSRTSVLGELVLLRPDVQALDLASDELDRAIDRMIRETVFAAILPTTIRTCKWGFPRTKRSVPHLVPSATPQSRHRRWISNGCRSRQRQPQSVTSANLVRSGYRP